MQNSLVVKEEDRARVKLQSILVFWIANEFIERSVGLVNQWGIILILSKKKKKKKTVVARTHNAYLVEGLHLLLCKVAEGRTIVIVVADHLEFRTRAGLDKRFPYKDGHGQERPNVDFFFLKRAR